MSRALAIDLGTTHSVVCVLEGGEPKIMVNAEGNRLTPSVIGFTKTGERVVGLSAKRQAVVHPERTIASIKRKIGASEPIKIGCRSFTPEQACAMIFQKLKADAEAYLVEQVDEVILTVPAYFNDAQRQSIKNAGTIAGMQVNRIINEPIAAALAYGLDKRNGTILVFHLGGGTFDVSVLEVREGVCEVKSTQGDSFLGGDDWDKRIMSWVAEELQRVSGIDLRTDRQALQRLTEAAERAKIELSSGMQTNINLP